MTTPVTGGPLEPVRGGQGITVRDHFATVALAAIIQGHPVDPSDTTATDQAAIYAADAAYRYAAAMVSRRPTAP